jgi:hypothetical protein
VKISFDLKNATSGPLWHWAKWIKPPVRSPIPILIPLYIGLWKNHLILRENNHAKFNIFCSFRLKKLWNDKCAYHVTKSFLAVSKVAEMCLPPCRGLFLVVTKVEWEGGPKVGEGYNMITSKQTRGVSHCGLAIYSKKHLKSKEEWWKFKHFTMQKSI